MKLFNEMGELANPESNYRCYRTQLKNASVPLLPYLACFLRDLIYMEEMPSTVLNNDGIRMINWGKMRQLGGIFQFVLKSQEFPYKIEPDFTLIPLLSQCQVLFLFFFFLCLVV
jgi:hypothetical protein